MGQFELYAKHIKSNSYVKKMDQKWPAIVSILLNQFYLGKKQIS